MRFKCIHAVRIFALNQVPLVLFGAVFVTFGVLSAKFFDWTNLVNILIQSSSTAIVATGMTFVLLTAGIDLSVGAIMFVSAAVAGKMALQGAPLPLTLAAMLGIGLFFGAFNAFFITRLRIMAFIVTLATLYLGRGLALWISQTRAMNLPESFRQLGAERLFNIPLPIIVFAAVLLVAHFALKHTQWGRQVYAVGNDVEVARKAGIDIPFVVASVYVVSGLCAAIGAIVSLSQLGAVSPTFGYQREFSAIAAAVLGGTSLFGGRGQVFPGTVLGAVLIQTVESGLVMLNADPYLYPLFTSAVIFLAVLLDSMRHGLLLKMSRRKIRVEKSAEP